MSESLNTLPCSLNVFALTQRDDGMGTKGVEHGADWVDCDCRPWRGRLTR
jgi:hypothetical protein